MRKHQLSPSASIVMSLALALGILVADVASVARVTVASAQAESGPYIPVAEATVIGGKIAAVGVVVNGVVTDGFFVGSVTVVDSLVDEGEKTDYGVLTGDSATGVLTGDSNTASGVLTGDSVTGVLTGDSATGVLTGDSMTGDSDGRGATVTGGVVEGDNVQIVDGAITGENLRVVGTTVTGGTYLY